MRIKAISKISFKNRNIIVGDFTYIANTEFESHVTHHYESNNDKLVIDKFCQIASGVTIGNNVVNKCIPSNSVAVGNPCKVIKEIRAI